MKRLLLVLFLLADGVVAMAQQDGDSWSLLWHGFVNPVLYGDTRQVVSGREQMMLFFPKPEMLSSSGQDSNATPQLNMLSITARLNLTITGPDVLGAKMKGFVEGDFTGATDATINMFRLRHAYIDMRWLHDELIMGQYWYPMVVEEIMPGTQPLNMGAPFHCYARYNQFRYYRRTNTPWEAMLTASFQLDNKSQGPLGASTEYLRRSLVPEMNFQIRYVGERLFAGAACNYLRVEPLAGIAASNWVYSFFGKYRFDHWTLKAQTLLNDNLYEGCSLGGYLMVNNLTTQTNWFMPVTFTTLWADLGRTCGKWRPGLFAGFAKKNGSLLMDDNSVVDEWGRGLNIDYLWRVQPRLEYTPGGGLTFAAEVEHTQVRYIRESPVVIDGEQSFYDDQHNTRFILSACYKF